MNNDGVTLCLNKDGSGLNLGDIVLGILGAILLRLSIYPALGCGCRLRVVVVRFYGIDADFVGYIQLYFIATANFDVRISYGVSAGCPFGSASKRQFAILITDSGLSAFLYLGCRRQRRIAA